MLRCPGLLWTGVRAVDPHRMSDPRTLAEVPAQGKEIKPDRVEDYEEQGKCFTESDTDRDPQRSMDLPTGGKGICKFICICGSFEGDLVFPENGAMQVLRKYGYHGKVSFTWQRPQWSVVAKTIAKFDHGTFWMYLGSIFICDDTGEEVVMGRYSTECLVEVRRDGTTHTSMYLEPHPPLLPQYKSI